MDEQQNIKKGVTAIIYDHMHKPFFLILKRKIGWEGWEFAKGGVEAGESDLDAVKREVIEETGLQKFKIVKQLEGVKKEYTDENNVLNSHTVFLIEASMNIPIHLPQQEHSTYLWSEADSVLAKLTWDSDKEILKKALEEIK